MCDWKFTDKNSITCILSCCFSCTFCRKVAAKERRNSRTSNVNKICKRCLLCKSIEFCTKCHKCPTCCTKSSCRVKIARVWEKWAALGVNPKVTSVLREGYILPFRTRPFLTRKPTVTSCYVDPHRNSYLLEALHQLLDKKAVELAQNPQSLGFYNRLFLVPKPNNRWRPILDLSKQQLFENTVFQNGDTRDNTNLPPDRGVGDFHRFQRCILPHTCTYKQPVQEVYAVSHSRQDLPIQSTTLWPVHSPHGIHCGSQRGEMACNERGYKDPPVPRRLVGQSHLPLGLSSTDKNSRVTLQGIGVAGKRGQIRAGTQTSFQLRRLPVRLEGRHGQTHHRTLADPTKQNTGDLIKPNLSGPEANVPDRSVNCHREASTFGQTTHETHTVASQEQLEGTRNPGEDNPHSKVTPPTPKMVAGGRQCQGQPLQVNPYPTPHPPTPHPHPPHPHPLSMLYKFLQTHQKRGGVHT